MDLLTALNSFTETRLSEFSINIQYNSNKQLNIKGDFTKSGESIYANYKLMDLAAGSQEPDERKAKIKALIRLVQLIQVKLIKNRVNVEKAFINEVGPKTLFEFQEYLNSLSEEDVKENIPVYNEKLVEENGHLFYTITYSGDAVTNLAHIQEGKYETLSGIQKSKSFEITEEDSIGSKKYSVKEAV